MHPHNTQSMPVDAKALILFRLADDPTVRLALAGDLGWHNGIGRIVEWSTLTPGAWTQHTTETMPVDAEAVVEIEGADGSRWIDHAGALVWWALPADEGLIVRYRVMQATATASSTSTPGTVGGTSTSTGTGTGTSASTAIGTSGTSTSAATSAAARPRRTSPRPAPRAAGRVRRLFRTPRRTAIEAQGCHCWAH